MFRIVISAIFFVLSIAGLVHHKIVAGVWFQTEDFMHHEPLIVLCLVVSLTILLGPRR